MAPKNKKKNAPKTSNADSPLIVNGFTVLQAKARETCKEPLFLYLKPHTSTLTLSEWPEGKTVQVHNVPPYCNEDNIKLIFDNCQIVKIHMQDKLTPTPENRLPFLQTTSFSRSYKVAYVVFKHLEDVQKACNLSYSKVRLLSNSQVPLCNAGVAGYIQDYRATVIDPAVIEKAANDYLTEYYQKQDEEEELAKAKEGVPDEDGFITVTRRGKFKGIRRTEQSDKWGREQHRKQRAKMAMKDFYRFQIRDTKRQHIAELQKKFEEDKKRVQEMRTARKFKPMQ